MDRMRIAEQRKEVLLHLCIYTIVKHLSFDENIKASNVFSQGYCAADGGGLW